MGSNPLGDICSVRTDFDECFTLTDQVGDGAFATVYGVRRRPTSAALGAGVAGQEELLAAKVMRPTATTEMISQEVLCLEAVQGHPNIVKFLGLFCEQVGEQQQWKMLMERCSDGDVKGVIQNHGAFSEERSIVVVGEGVFSALVHIHDCGLLHRDVSDALNSI